MSITDIDSIENTDTFGVWKDTTNQIIDSLEKAVTIGSGETNSGEVVIDGSISTSNGMITDTISPLDVGTDLVEITSNALVNGVLNIIDWSASQTSGQNLFNISSPTGKILRINDSEGLITSVNLQIDNNILPGTIERNLIGNVTGNLTGDVTGDVTGNASTASTLQTSRTISLGGDVSGSANFDGSSNITISATVADNSHNHMISNIDGLQSQLDGKISSVVAGGGLTGGGTSGSVTVSHSDTSSQGDINTNDTTVIDNISVDTYGHVTSMGTRDMAGSIRRAIGGTTFPIVGSYMLLRAVAGNEFIYNDTYTGSNLAASSDSGQPELINSNTIRIIGGSWRCAGRSAGGQLTVEGRPNQTTLWVRYA